MSLRRIKGKNVWIFQTEIDGKTWSRSTGQTNKKLALKEVTKLKALADSMRTKNIVCNKLSHAIAQEIKRAKREVSQQRADRVEDALENLKKRVGDVLIEKIDTRMLETYQVDRLQVVAKTTVGLEIGYILRMLRRQGFHVAKPSNKQGDITYQRHFTNDEIKRFFVACPARLKLLYQMLLVSGARQSELVPSDRSLHTPLLKSDVNLDAHTVKIRTAKQRRGAKPKIRLIKLPEWVIEPLREHLEGIPDDGYVFKPLANSARDFDAILEKAKIPKIDPTGAKVTSHSFRHSYATLMSEALGGNAFLLKEVLGHCQISTTERYTHPTAPQLDIAFPEIM